MGEEAVWSRRVLNLFTLPSLPLPSCSRTSRGRREAKTMDALFTPFLFSSCLLSSFSSASSALPSSLLCSCPFLRRVSFPQQQRRRLAKAARSSRRLCPS